jgi:hypothetical protein
VALEAQGIPTVTLISCSFCTLAQTVSRQLDYPGLPIYLLPHPIGDPDLSKVRNIGIDAAADVARLLTTPAIELTSEFQTKEFPLPENIVAKF